MGETVGSIFWGEKGLARRAQVLPEGSPFSPPLSLPEGDIAEDIARFMAGTRGRYPLQELGAAPGLDPGSKVIATNAIIQDSRGSRVLGEFIRKIDPKSRFGRLIKSLGRKDLEENVIHITADGLMDNRLERVTRHEFMHSGLQKLEKGPGSSRPLSHKFILTLPVLRFESILDEDGDTAPLWSRLIEEDYVQLIEAMTDFSKIPKAEEYFRHLRKTRIGIPVIDMIKHPAIQGAVMYIQKKADDLARSRGLPGSIINFPDYEKLIEMMETDRGRIQ